MEAQYAHFSELPARALFTLNGNQYRKRSTRTAEIVKPASYAGAWFYFRARELVIVGRHSRIA